MLAGSPFNILNKLDRVDDAIDANADIAERILGATGDFPEELVGTARESDMDKARTTIRQYYRDWSEEGSAERKACYGPILDDLADIFGETSDKHHIKVLVPGAGLGRLMFEICKLGYHVEGNEISQHQLMASNLVLNHCSEAGEMTLFPNAYAFSNQVSLGYQLKSVKIPDVCPRDELILASEGKEVHAFERMGIIAGDFSTFYAQEAQRAKFHAVTTSFFIDTAPNVIRYIEAIHNTLREGAYWFNLGPLLWHFETKDPSEHRAETPGNSEPTNNGGEPQGIEAPGNIELTNEELLLLIERMGFVIVGHEIRDDGYGYIHDEDSMSRSSYKVSHFVARKIG